MGLFFVFVVPPFTARDTLKAWQEKNHPWLELSDVHRETTENIRVTVIPFYMGMRVAGSLRILLIYYLLLQHSLSPTTSQLKHISLVLLGVLGKMLAYSLFLFNL